MCFLSANTSAQSAWMVFLNHKTKASNHYFATAERIFDARIKAELTKRHANKSQIRFRHVLEFCEIIRIKSFLLSSARKISRALPQPAMFCLRATRA